MSERGAAEADADAAGCKEENKNPTVMWGKPGVQHYTYVPISVLFQSYFSKVVLRFCIHVESLREFH